MALASGAAVTAHRLVLAYGVRDTLPDLPGLPERWGHGVLHCPYCHGYELNRGPVGVLARNEMAMHQAMLLPDWGPTTLFTQGAFVPTEEHRRTLAARGVAIEDVPIISLSGPAPALDAVQLEDGREVPVVGLFIAPQTALADGLGAELGCKTTDGPTGPYIAVDGKQATSIPGVFAAGDLAAAMANATLAAAAGAMAGFAAHQSLIFAPNLSEDA
ncbi:NAD(P)/FAD-dependent oxidoreductase [Salipiger sp. IMCC34102]|uniref:NAD(P)/FAD-dependent oxidoreductase n=1 Tax=Salipiger sp. IMCC34102 TaxID=2510647 RepID=UPI001F5C1033|nr:NAD(P)/FAD-dependent oxidoreductase [Salipiger sp. IMCC34102]